MHAIDHFIVQYGYAGLFGLLMFGIIGLPVPDETLLTFCGVMVHKGELLFLPTVLAAFLGSCSGITVSYGLGRLPIGYLVHKYGHYVRITPEHIDRVHQWFDKLGRWVLTFGYFIPGVRHLSAVVAGMSRMPYPAFALYAYLGALLWSTAFITVGYYAGEEWEKLSGPVHRYILIGAGVLVLVGAGVYFITKKQGKRKKG